MATKLLAATGNQQAYIEYDMLDDGTERLTAIRLVNNLPYQIWLGVTRLGVALDRRFVDAGFSREFTFSGNQRIAIANYTAEMGGYHST